MCCHSLWLSAVCSTCGCMICKSTQISRLHGTRGKIVYQDMTLVENMALYCELAITASIISVSECAQCTLHIELDMEIQGKYRSECNRWKIFSIKTHSTAGNIRLHSGFRSHSNYRLAFFSDENPPLFNIVAAKWKC